MVKKQYGAAASYETKLKRVMERLDIKKKASDEPGEGHDSPGLRTPNYSDAFGVGAKTS